MRTFSLLSLTLSAVTQVFAGFDYDSKANLAVYWGQNSWGQTHPGDESRWQQQLSHYCADKAIDIVILAFITALKSPDQQPAMSFANADHNCTTASSTRVCHQIEEDIKTCQSSGKTILISIGGDSNAVGNFVSVKAAEDNAGHIWNLFGPDPGLSFSKRPFGAAAVDGFDLDFEGPSPAYIGAWAKKMCDLISRAKDGKKRFLTAAPLCPSPGMASMHEVLTEQDLLDAVFVQFYNNPSCGIADTGKFNYKTWEGWAKNAKATVFVGIPASESAGRGYIVPDKLRIVEETQKNDNFGGVMLWDASQSWNNDGYHGKIRTHLRNKARVIDHI